MSLGATYLDNALDLTDTSSASLSTAAIDCADANTVGIVVGVRWEGGDNTVTVDDSAGNGSYTSAGKVNNGAAEDPSTELFYFLGSASDGANVITAHFSPNEGFISITAYSFTYTGTIEAGTAITKASTVNQDGSPILDTNLVAIAGDISFCLKGSYNTGTGVDTWNDGFSGDTGLDWSGEMAYLVGAYTGKAGCTLLLADTWNCMGIVFSEVAGSNENIEVPLGPVW